MSHSIASSPTRHNPLTRYLRVLLFCFVAALLRVMVFAPLAFLLIFPAGSPFRYLALLCPLLLVLFLLPQRFSFAQGLVGSRLQKYFSFDVSLGMRPYGEKLGESLLHGLSVLKWGIPLGLMLAGSIYGADYFYSGTGATELFSLLTSLGKSATGIYAGISVFFGNAQARELSGGFAEGIYVVLGIFGLGLLLLLYGVMRNSAFRYIWAQATQENHSPRVEARRRLKGRRFLQLLTALANLLLLLPFLWAVLRSIKEVVGDLSTLGMTALAGNFSQAFDVGKAVFPLLIAFFCLYLPLLPLRRILTVWFATASVPTAYVMNPPAPVIPAPAPQRAPAVAHPPVMEAPVAAHPPVMEIPAVAPVAPPPPVTPAAPAPAPFIEPPPPVPVFSPSEPMVQASAAPPPEIESDAAEDQVFFAPSEESESLDDHDPASFTLGQ